jgi:hypothetical protein
MNRLTNEQRLQIIQFYYQNSCSVKKVYRALLPIYGQFNRPTEGAIRALVTEFRTKFTLLDIKPPTRLRRVRTEENIVAVSASVTDDRELSIRRRAQQLGLCYSTTWKILRKDLGVKPFKIQLVQVLKPNDLPQRRIFGEWALDKLAEDPLFYRKIVFSDEAHSFLVEMSKIAVFRVKSSQKHCKSYQCIQKKSLFGVDYGLAESLGRISSKMMRIATLL